MENKTQGERFIIAFNAIETYLTRLVNSDRYVSYSEMVRRLSTTNAEIARYQRYLEEFGDLRNAIVHERIDGELIAEPHLKLVERIEKIASILTEPERVKDYFVRNVSIIHEDDPLRKALEILSDKHFSKLPVYKKDGHFSGLLTTETITHWLATHMDEWTKNLNTSIHEVIEKDVKHREVSFLPLDATLLSVVEVFERSLKKGRRLNAVIITKDGASNQKAKGIISISDLPLIYDKLGIFSR